MGVGGRSARSKGKGKARQYGSGGETRIKMSGLPPIWCVPSSRAGRRVPGGLRDPA